MNRFNKLFFAGAIMTAVALILNTCEVWYVNLLFMFFPLMYVVFDYLILGLSILCLVVITAMSVAFTYIIDSMEFSIEYDKKQSYGRYAFKAVIAAIIIKLLWLCLYGNS